MFSTYSRYHPSSFDRMPALSSTHARYSPGYTPSVGKPPAGPRSTSLTRVTPARKTSTLSTREVVHDYGLNTSSRPSSRGSGSQTLPRALPKGPGPLDPTGRKLNNFSLSATRASPTKNYSVTHTGPVKATHDYSTSYGSSYGTSGVGTLGRHGSLTTNYTSSSGGSRPGSLRGRRSSSLANVNDGIDGLKITDIENDDAPIRSSRRTSRLDDSYLSSNVTPRGSRLESDSSDDIVKSDTLKRTNRTSVRNRYDDDDVINGTGSRSYNGYDKSSRTRAESPLEESWRNSRQNSPSVGSLSRYSNRGKVGLRNLGNTCFMNSVLQCLSNTKYLLEYCLEDGFEKDKNTSTSSMRGSLITAYAKLMKDMWSDKDSYVSPNAFKTQIQRFAPRFMGYAQQDSQEFLRYLLEGLHEDVNRVTSKPKPVSIDDDKFSSDQEKAKEYWRVYLTYDNSYIVDLFVGQLRSTLKFDCGHASTTFDPFWDLSLPIPKGRYSDATIYKCINLFMKDEQLDHDELPTCSKCKKRRACTKGFSIQRFPKVLVLHLKRFSQGRYSQKVSTTVDFPQDLDLTEYAADQGPVPVAQTMLCPLKHIYFFMSSNQGRHGYKPHPSPRPSQSDLPCSV
ncbi:hypothetical protein FSP39_006027 [Pinctada imbricata]|uniref:ubiquitinyl hydrolase 1 n=1 Tax=Pinctada imbricata TaxID=66713 RepID=A0AA89CD62_PINIB|nr:hypothetical protein FSP39_006027 [Pinctada imbricata]